MNLPSLVLKRNFVSYTVPKYHKLKCSQCNDLSNDDKELKDLV